MNLLRLALITGLAVFPALLFGEVPRLVVHDEVLHRLDSRIFGHLMEKAPKDREPGVEGALDADGALRGDVGEKIEWLRPPLIRFPGGTIVEHMSWRELIDDEDGGRAEGHRFGLHEFLDLTEDLDSAPLLVVPLREAIMRERPAEEVAREAAEYLAYCNATDDPLRRRNGREAPWNVRLWQLGNESFDYLNLAPEFVAEHGAAGIFDFHVETLNAVASAMLAVDPSIEFVVDVEVERFHEGFIAEVLPRLTFPVSYLSRHYYTPWSIREVEKNGESFDAGELSAEDVWRAWVAPLETGADGMVGALDDVVARRIAESGHPMAVTEWNWNGGWWVWDRERGSRPPAPHLAYGVGAASLLHQLMRSGDVVRIGCQSMLVGSRWDIAGIRVSPEEEAIFRPTAQVVGLYARHHGPELLRSELHGARFYEQPFRMQKIPANDRVGVLDIIVTRGDGALFLHVINRSFDEDMAVLIDLGAVAEESPTRAVSHVLSGGLDNRGPDGERLQVADVTGEEANLTSLLFEHVFPARSVSVLELSFHR